MVRAASKSLTLRAAILALACTGAASAPAQELDGEGVVSSVPPMQTMVYRGEPLEVTIAATEESVFKFPWGVRAGMSSDMYGTVRTETSGDTVLFTPRIEFDSTRFWFEDPDSGALMQVDITSREDAAPQRLQFVDGRVADAQAQVANTNPEPRQATGGEQGASAGGERLLLTTLARVAMQWSYSPDHAIEQHESVGTSTLRGAAVMQDLIPGADVDARPAAEWQTADGYYIAAVELRNRGSYPVHFEPSMMRLARAWRAVSPRSTSLAPGGQLGDTTILAVVSEVPWRELTR